jgi:hypothetical protein
MTRRMTALRNSARSLMVRRTGQIDWNRAFLFGSGTEGVRRTGHSALGRLVS